MKNILSLCLLAAIGLVFADRASAQTTATQDVTVVVEAVNAISVSSGTLTLTINSATPGTGLNAATNTATTYAVTTNGTSIKITGALSAAYAAGIDLAVELSPPTNASATSRTLTTVAQDLVTGITELSASGLTISYTATATESAATNDPAGEAKTVTFTITS